MLDVSIKKYYNHQAPLIFKCPEGSSGSMIDIDIDGSYGGIHEIDALVNDLGFYYIQGRPHTRSDVKL